MMKALIMAVAIVWGLVLTAEPALAQCTSQTVFLPDGSVRFCQTCCLGGSCTTQCM